MAATYWEIGCRIVGSEQQGQQPKYREALIKQLAEDLEPRFGRGKLIVVVQVDSVWANVNFKETQLKKRHVG